MSDVIMANIRYQLLTTFTLLIHYCPKLVNATAQFLISMIPNFLFRLVSTTNLHRMMNSSKQHNAKILKHICMSYYDHLTLIEHSYSTIDVKAEEQ